MALTDKDLRAIGDLISEKIQTLPRREEVKAMIDEAIEGLEKEIRGLPTRDELISLIDQVIGKMQSTDQEHTMLNHRVREHEDRITSLEEIHPGGDHSP